MQHGSELCQWLWLKLLHVELAEFMEFHNGVRMRTDKQKPGPLGMLHNEAFSMVEQWGGCNCLLPIDVNVIREIKDAMGGESIGLCIILMFDCSFVRACWYSIHEWGSDMRGGLLGRGPVVHNKVLYIQVNR